MPNVFDITAPTSSVNVTEQGRGSVAITVTNSVIEDVVSGRVRIKPIGDTDSEWLQLEGKAEQDFAARESHQFKVHIHVPLDTPPGSYSFRLDAYDVDNPDEHFDEGQAITFTVKEKLAPVVNGKPKFKWWIPAVIAAVVVIGIGIALLMGDNKMPDLKGQEYEAAVKEVLDKGLHLTPPAMSIVTKEEEIGKVVSQKPAAGSEMAKGQTVYLTVGKAKHVVEGRVVANPMIIYNRYKVAPVREK
jgi:hypothetical protein